MGTSLLTDVLARLDDYAEDDVLFRVPDAEPTQVLVVRFSPSMTRERADGASCFLEVGTLREMRDAARRFYESEPTTEELVRAAEHYARTDCPWFPPRV
jgi:hypothetical protein